MKNIRIFGGQTGLKKVSRRHLITEPRFYEWREAAFLIAFLFRMSLNIFRERSKALVKFFKR
jgi:hypothetical protein